MEAQVSGFAGAVFKSFKLKRDATKFLKAKEQTAEVEMQATANKFETDENKPSEIETGKEPSSDQTNEENNITLEHSGDEGTNDLEFSDLITIDEYDSSAELLDLLAKKEIELKTLWEYFSLLWDLHTEEKKRIDQIETHLKRTSPFPMIQVLKVFSRPLLGTGTQTEGQPDGEHYDNHAIQDIQDNSSENIFKDKTISTSQFEQLLTSTKDENVVFMNRNENLSKEVEELTEENRKLNQDNIYLQDRNTVLEHAFSAVLQQNNHVRNEWQQVKNPDGRTRSDMKAKKVRDITAENRFTPLLGEELESHSEITNNAPSDFFASQRSLR